MLTVLQEKLAEAHGLAMSASIVTQKVEAIVPDVQLRRVLQGLRADAEDTRARCLDVEQRLGEALAREMLEHANTTKEKGADLAGAWFKAGTGPLAAWSFLAMGEAAEVTVWSAVAALARRSTGARDISQLATWALDVQSGHLETALHGSIRLAEFLDADAPRFG